jgi:hypothetical protein
MKKLLVTLILIPIISLNFSCKNNPIQKTLSSSGQMAFKVAWPEPDKELKTKTTEVNYGEIIVNCESKNFTYIDNQLICIDKTTIFDTGDLEIEIK